MCRKLVDSLLSCVNVSWHSENLLYLSVTCCVKVDIGKYGARVLVESSLRHPLI